MAQRHRSGQSTTHSNPRAAHITAQPAAPRKLRGICQGSSVHGMQTSSAASPMMQAIRCRLAAWYQRWQAGCADRQKRRQCVRGRAANVLVVQGTTIQGSSLVALSKGVATARRALFRRTQRPWPTSCMLSRPRSRSRCLRLRTTPLAQRACLPSRLSETIACSLSGRVQHGLKDWCMSNKPVP